MQYQVKDGARTLQFDGTLLAESTSWRYGSTRWIEFKLYRTASGSYILSRVGVSVIFHAGACPLVDKYGLSDIPVDELGVHAVSCPECQPSTYDLPVVYPEKHRHWAQVSGDPVAVLDALYKYDDNDTRYLTKVAERLLDAAAAQDASIDAVYRIELIP